MEHWTPCSVDWQTTARLSRDWCPKLSFWRDSASPRRCVAGTCARWSSYWNWRACVEFDADGARRQAMWAPESHKSAAGRVDLADRLGRLLTEELTGAVSAADITVALNRRAKGGRVTFREVEGALPLSPLVELLEDGRWQGRFEYLTRRGDQVFRLLDAAGRPLELRDVVREINARSRQRPVNLRNLSNQLAGDDRFVPIGKSGSWGLASRDAAAALSIPDLIQEILRLAGKPMLGRDIDTAVRARRPAGANSVAIYLATRPEFVHLPDGTWVLATWPEAAAMKGKPRVPSLGERIAEVAIPHSRRLRGRRPDCETLSALWRARSMFRPTGSTRISTATPPSSVLSVKARSSSVSRPRTQLHARRSAGSQVSPSAWRRS